MATKTVTSKKRKKKKVETFSRSRYRVYQIKDGQRKYVGSVRPLRMEHCWEMGDGIHVHYGNTIDPQGWTWKRKAAMMFGTRQVAQRFITTLPTYYRLKIEEETLVSESELLD